MHVMLEGEVFTAGKERVYRQYREEGLHLRSKCLERPKTIVAQPASLVSSRPGKAWAMDFVFDQLVDGKIFRALTIIDVFSRGVLAIAVGERLGCEHVVADFTRLVAERSGPEATCMDNETVFTGRLLDVWACHHRVQLNFSPPAKPTNKSVVENFHGSLRDECLNVSCLESIDEAKAIVEAWRADYNESRPHEAHNGMPTGELARRTKDVNVPQVCSGAEN